MREDKVGIVSLGLIGGSLFKCLKKHFKNLIVVTRNTDTLAKVSDDTIVASSDYSVLQECDMVFVCSPMNKTLEVLEILENVLKPETIVTDVCSLKQFVMQKERPYVFIGSHPMAGTEKNGFDASFSTLFEGAKWVITTSENTPEEAVSKLEGVISLTGASVIKTDAKSHDKAAALISHMPMLLAQALMLTASKNELAMKLASSGFRDMTRLALSNTEMAWDMMSLNTDNMFNSLLEVIENTRELFSEDYQQKIEQAKKLRLEMYDENGKNVL